MKISRTMNATAYTIAGVPTSLGVAEVEYVVRSDGRFAVVQMVTDRGIGFALPENAEHRQAVRDADDYYDRHVRGSIDVMGRRPVTRADGRTVDVSVPADDGTNDTLDADWRD